MAGPEYDYYIYGTPCRECRGKGGKGRPCPRCGREDPHYASKSKLPPLKGVEQKWRYNAPVKHLSEQVSPPAKGNPICNFFIKLIRGVVGISLLWLGLIAVGALIAVLLG